MQRPIRPIRQKPAGTTKSSAGLALLTLHGFVFLVVLLVTGWSSRLRDLALGPGEHRNYYFAIALYVFSLLAISKVVGFGWSSLLFAWNADTTSPTSPCARGCGTRPKRFCLVLPWRQSSLNLCTGRFGLRPRAGG